MGTQSIAFIVFEVSCLAGIILMTACQTGYKKIEITYELGAKKIEAIHRLDTDEKSYGEEITSKASQAKLMLPSDTLGFVLFDPMTQQVIESKNESASFIPASTTKILTTVAALKILGPQFNFKTQIFVTGRVEKNTLQGDLYLKGSGDPSLTASHLMGLVSGLVKQGIKKVNGNFYYDDSQVVSRLKIREMGDSSAAYNPGMGALSVDFNQFVLRWQIPRASPSTLDVTVTPNFSWISLGLAKEQKTSQQSIIYEDSEDFERWLISPTLNAPGQQKLPVRHPTLFAVTLFTDLCKINGIELSAPKPKAVPKKADLLVAHSSPGLLEMVERSLEYSNNLMAELILVAAASKIAGKPVDIEQAAQILKIWLAKEIRSTQWETLRLVNGSGLTTANVSTPSQMTSVLNYVDQFQFEGRSFESLLPVAGWKGTMENRLVSPEAAFRVWAKTGTMFYASALAGYLYTRSHRRLIFAVLLSDPQERKLVDSFGDEVPSHIAEQANSWIKKARQVQDSLVQHWVVKY
jgi:D-alanyl-D-alanine carboxypeptidase/D-alanyl-D-alanine-endopeptidase (penicillin-binding protein 4)